MELAVGCVLKTQTNYHLYNRNLHFIKNLPLFKFRIYVNFNIAVCIPMQKKYKYETYFA